MMATSSGFPASSQVSTAGAQRRQRLLFSLLVVFFALQQGGLGLLDYLPAATTRILQAILVGSMLLMASLGVAHFGRLKRFYARLVLAFVALNLLYGTASALFGGVRVIFHLESAVFALALVPIVSDTKTWMTVLRGLFWGGMLLITLNLVPLLHWGGWIDLQPQFITRLVVTDSDISHLDPFSFGVFGRTESFEVAGQFFARLQGWALEPLHWAYFAVVTLAIGLVLHALRPRRRDRYIYRCCFALIAVHLFFIYSASMWLTLAVWILVAAMIAAIRRWRWLKSREAFLVFLAVVVGIGFLVPFALSLIPGIDTLLYTEQIIGKGGNWQSKIGFLSFGPQLFTRFIPLHQPDLQTSHNLVLEMYLHYGYFLIAPLLGFYYWFCRHAISGLPISLSAGTLLILLCHVMLVPSVMFYPSGVLFFSLAMVAAWHFRDRARSVA